jgi:hypothetical protein
MNKNDLAAAIVHLINRVPWGVEIVIGTRLSMEFGRDVLTPSHKQAHGEWHLLFQNCHWRVENTASILIGSDDDDLPSAIHSVQFGTVKGIRLIPPSNDLQIDFDGGLRLNTFLTHSRSGREPTQWYLYCPDETVLIAEGGGTLIRKNRNES